MPYSVTWLRRRSRLRDRLCTSWYGSSATILGSSASWRSILLDTSSTFSKRRTASCGAGSTFGLRASFPRSSLPHSVQYQGIKTETCGAGLPQLREVEARLNREMTARMRGALGGVSTEHDNLTLDTSLHSNISFNSVNDSASARHSSFLIPTF